MNFTYKLEILNIEGISSDKKTAIRISAPNFKNDFLVVIEDSKLTDVFELKGHEVDLSGRRLLSNGKLPVGQFDIEFGIIKNILRHEKYLPQDRIAIPRGQYCPFKDKKGFVCENGKVKFTSTTDTGKVTQVSKPCHFSNKCKLDLKK